MTTAAAVAVFVTLGARAQQPPPAVPPAAQQPGEITTTITGAGGAPPRLAVPQFIALTNDAETQALARTITDVLFDDLTYEREFALIPRDVYNTIPPATSVTDVPFARWRELNADALVIGTVQKVATKPGLPAGIRIEVRLFALQGSEPIPPVPFGKEYSGSAANPRLYAHTVADEIHLSQRALRGVARTKLTFNSDRDGERIGGTIETRSVKEIYIADYDGENQRRVTVGRSLNITSTWSPDSGSIAYSSYRRGQPNIFISNIYKGTLEELTKNAGQNFTPSWSPDGTRLCFASTRDGNIELYIVNRDGSNLRRITNHPAADLTPTWSPSGTQIAFTSDRTGTPQIYIVGADGLGLQKLTSEPYADRATWSPAPFNEVAYAARTGPGLDIKVISLATREVRQLTFGEGTNESPSWAPNGRHLAFTSTRSGKTQIFTVARDGKNLRQITRTGSNFTPDWSR
jgi:TolB protein